MITNFLQINIKAEASILFALKHMDKIERKLLLVVEKEKFIGLLSIGDIQRAIINNTDLNSTIGSIMRKDILVARPDNSIEEIKLLMLNARSEFMPVVTQDGHLLNVYFWEDLFGEKSGNQLHISICQL